MNTEILLLDPNYVLHLILVPSFSFFLPSQVDMRCFGNAAFRLAMDSVKDIFTSLPIVKSCPLITAENGKMDIIPNRKVAASEFQRKDVADRTA